MGLGIAMERSKVGPVDSLLGYLGQKCVPVRLKNAPPGVNFARPGSRFELRDKHTPLRAPTHHPASIQHPRSTATLLMPVQDGRRTAAGGARSRGDQICGPVGREGDGSGLNTDTPSGIEDPHEHPLPSQLTALDLESHIKGQRAADPGRLPTHTIHGSRVSDSDK